MDKIKQFTIIINIIFLLLSLTACSSLYSKSPEYSVKKLAQKEGTDYNFILGNHHFITLIDQGGTLNFRPHPSDDPNAWGSSWYAQPFLPAATLSHTIIESVKSNSQGISVKASGKVSYKSNDTYGNWNINLFFKFDELKRVITGVGSYSISLQDNLNKNTGNLNLYKIASNYLVNVPLLSGKYGNTGDMKEVIVKSNNFNFTWAPNKTASYFPQTYHSNIFSVDVIGDFNEVNTGAQGFQPIAPALKPSMTVKLSSQNPEDQIFFGAVFNESQKAIFYDDNIGITPLIMDSSNIKNFVFDINFLSK